MPAHWYYDTQELVSEFGRIDRYLPPPETHPGSILWRSRYQPREPAYDILGDQRRYWGLRGVHYHQNLVPGENTLNLKLMNIALSLVDEYHRYDRNEYLRRYQAYMLDPGGHRDTYMEECHRGFFENLRRGVSPEKSAIREKHIGGVVPVVPLYARLRALGHGHDAARDAVIQHVSVTHAGQIVARAANTLIRIASEVIESATRADRTDPTEAAPSPELAEILTTHLERQDLEYLRGPIARLAVSEQPERVIGRTYSPACYLQDALPATFYLILRYADRPQEGLIENVMVGGDNCHRGAVLGALFGLSLGTSAFPNAWVDGLVDDPDRG